MSVAHADPAHPLDSGVWSLYQKWVLALASLAFCVDGLANQVLGLALPVLIRDWGLPREAFAPVAAIGLVGVAVGAAVGGVLGDRWGRRSGLIISLLLFGLMTAAGFMARGISDLLVLRLLAGIGIGGAIPNGAALVFELTPLRYRTLAIGIAMTFIPVGGVVAGLLGSALLPAVGWRDLFLVCGLLPVTAGVLFLFWLPESPRYLARFPTRAGQLTALLQRCGLSSGDAVALVAGGPPKQHLPLKSVFGSGMLGETLALWAAFFFCLLASYTMFSWVPTMLMGQGFPLPLTSAAMTVFNLGGMAGSVAGGWMIGRMGSRYSAILQGLGAVIGAVTLGVSVLGPDRAVFTMVTLAIEGFFIGALHNGMYTLAAHMYPPAVRATGVGAAAGTGRIGAVLSSFTGALTLKFAGASGYFIVIAVAVGFSMLAILMVRRQIPKHGAPATGGVPVVSPASAG